YSDCQQIIVYLPVSYVHYLSVSIINIENGEMIFVDDVNNLVLGSVKLILASDWIHPGKYRMEILSRENIQHHICFTKRPDMLSSTDSGPLSEEKKEDQTPMEYRDGFGRTIKNSDLDMRKNAIEQTLGKIFRSVEFVNQGKEGTVIYHEFSRTIKFYMELGGNDIVFYLNIPSASDWEHVTGFSLQERDSIIEFVANETQKHQAPNCTYSIEEATIYFIHK
ncbi:MAG TPA: hypothetical protein PLR22_04700, partial [Saprospiraceae bacterium]|nr:hypothetical protein [Saprospiraceae bacterium]